MATDGEAYGISVGIYAAILVGTFVAFSIWRRLARTRKFYAPKRFVQEQGRLPPPRLPDSFLGWVPRVVKLTEAEIIAAAGIDAAIYLKFLRCCWEIFFVVSILVLAICLPLNLTSNEVDKLMDLQDVPVAASEYTFWIPPPPPASPPTPGQEPPKEDSEKPVAPKFYDKTADPPQPAGLIVKAYANEVPPLPPAPPGLAWWYDSRYTPQDYYFSDLDKTTLSNVPPKSIYMIGHALVAWAITAVVFLQLWRYCREALRLRMFYLLNTPRGAESHSILATDIPAIAHGTIPDRLDGTLLKFVPQSLKDKAFAQVNALSSETAETAVDAAGSTNSDEKAGAAAAAAAMSTGVTSVDENTGRWEAPDRWDEAVKGIRAAGCKPTDGAAVGGMVEREFREIYQEDFAHAHMVYDTTKLDGLVAEYEKLAGAAEDLVDDYIAKGRRGDALKPKMMTVIGAKMGAWGREKYGLKPTKVNAFDFYNDRLTFLKGEIETAQKEARESVWPSAFVTFNRRTTQVIASGALMCEDLTAWRCQAAPRSEEIIWKNLGMRTWERSARGALMWTAFVLLAAFYMIPVAAVQAILATNASVGFIQDIPIVSSLITAILPGLALVIFIALLPPIIKAMNRFAGMISISEIDLALMTRFFIFQVVAVFFGSFIAGSAANQFKQLVNDPGSIVTLLGTAAPQTAIFFLTYVTLRALFIVPFSILRLVPFIIFFVKSKFLASTERAKARLWQNQMFSYGTKVPNDTMVALLGLTFACICPIIAPVAFLFFTTAYIVRKHDLLYVFRQPYQAGGMAWPRIFNQIITGLFVFHGVMICLLALKKSIAGPIICIPLPILTFFFARAVASTFWRPMEALSLMTAAEIDAKEFGINAAAAPTGPAATAIKDASDGAAAAEADIQRYMSPSFLPLDERHNAIMEDCRRVKAVSEGGADQELFERDAVVSEDIEEINVVDAAEEQIQDAAEAAV